MIFTDIDMSGYNIPDNVHVHAMTLEQIRQKHLDFEPVLNVPYKLCDHKPMYGLIFENYIAGYDFRGHVDTDIIWKDIGSFITDELMDSYDRISRRGHFNFYRNTEDIRRFILNKLSGWNISYRDILRTNKYICLDEQGSTARLFSIYTHGGIMLLNLLLCLQDKNSLCVQEGLYRHSGGLEANYMPSLLKDAGR